MTRKSTHTDERLISAALELLDESGFAGLKVRRVAEKAGVNPGMFHYHFKTKEEFTRRVLKDAYEKFFQDFSLESGGEGTSLERLRRTLMSLGRFVRKNRRLLIGLFQDAMHNNKIVVKFAMDNFPRHALVIASLIRQCQGEGRLDKKPFHLVVPLLIGALGVPNIAVGLLEHLEVKSLFGVGLLLFKNQILSDEALSQRIDIALRGLGAPERKA